MTRQAGAIVGMLFLAQAAAAQLTQQGSPLAGTGAAGAADRGVFVGISADGTAAILGHPTSQSFVLSDEGAGLITGRLVAAGHGNDSLYQALVAIQQSTSPSVAGIITNAFLATLASCPADSQILTTQLRNIPAGSSVAISTDCTAQLVNVLGATYYNQTGTATLGAVIPGAGTGLFTSTTDPQVPLTSWQAGGTTYDVFGVAWTPKRGTPRRVIPRQGPLGPTIGGREEGQDIFQGLGHIGVNWPAFETFVSTAITSGLNAAADAAVQNRPSICSRLPNGVLVDFGSGYTSPTGDVFTGSITITYDQVSINGNTISGQYAVANALTKNGRAFPIANANGAFTATQQSNGKVVGDVTVNGTGTDASVAGSAQFDTSQCARYPIGGTVTMTVGGQSTQVSFNNACDGSFDWGGDKVRCNPTVNRIPSPTCASGYGDQLWFDGFFHASWAGNSFQASYSFNGPAFNVPSAFLVEQDGTIQGTLSADRTVLLSCQVQEHRKFTIPGHSGFFYCLPGVASCTEEAWRSYTVSNVSRDYFSTPSLSRFNAGVGQFTSWSNRVVDSGVSVGYDGKPDHDCMFALASDVFSTPFTLNLTPPPPHP